MPVAIRVDRNGQTVYREVDRAADKMQQVFRRGFIMYMRALKKRANHEILHGKKTGRVYRIHGTWASRRTRPDQIRFRNHRASAPYETHANLSGRLRRSLSWKVYGWQKAEFGYGVSTDASNKAPYYAPFLEFGTKHRSSANSSGAWFMYPRPTIKNAVEKEPSEPHFRSAFDAEFG